MPTPASVPSIKERIKAFFERVTIEGATAIEELPSLYTADVHFINPVGDNVGLEAFTKNWVRAFKQYSLFEFKDLEVTGSDEMFSLTYSMNIKLRLPFSPVFTTAMATDCHAKDGKVYFCRDYFDVGGSLLAPFPPLLWVYKKLAGLVVA